jgi:hypothetical protein
MALVCCILGKFLGVVCHCFPPRLDIPTFATRCLHIRNDVRDPSSERWNYGRERFSGNFVYMASLLMPLGIFYMPQIYDMGLTAHSIFIHNENHVLTHKCWKSKSGLLQITNVALNIKCLTPLIFKMRVV